MVSLVKRLFLLSLFTFGICQAEEEQSLRERLVDNSGKAAAAVVVVGGCVLTRRSWHKVGWVSKNLFNSRLQSLDQSVLQVKSAIIQVLNGLSKKVSEVERRLVGKIDSTCSKLSQDISGLKKSVTQDSAKLDEVQQQMTELHAKVDRVIKILEDSHKN